jgi:S1-C subfamily serine protease
MSQNYDSDRPEQGLPQSGPDNPLSHDRRYPRGQNDTRSPRRDRRILLFAIGVIALAVWTTWCGLIVSMNPEAASTASAPPKTMLNQAIIASDDLSGVNEQLSGLIESNARIKPGDSGGPLVNAYGQVIGMDTAASSEYRFQRLSAQVVEQAYSIPVDEALSIAKRMESGITTPDIHIGATAFLGLEILSSNGSSAGGFSGFGASSQGSTWGVTIAGTVPGSPAAGAGLTAGDTITAVADLPISTTNDIARTLVPYHPGDKISITWVNQYGQSHTTTLTLTSGPAA